MKNINIKFTEEEASVLIKLINISVLSRGLEVAESALYLVNKIEKSFKK